MKAVYPASFDVIPKGPDITSGISQQNEAINPRSFFMQATKDQFKRYHRFAFYPAEIIWLVRQLLLKTVTPYHRSESQIHAEYDLILKCQEDPQYFAPLYEEYYDSIFIFIHKRVDQEEVTAELTSQVFFKCLKNLSSYRYQGVPFSAWLYKIAINEVNQFFRRRKRLERIVSLREEHVGLLIDEIEYREPEIDTHVLISALLEQLSDREVQFLELRFFENRSFKEIGYLLGISEVNAKVKTYRIIDKLKKIAQEIKYH